jgi:hypothetical protein
MFKDRDISDYIEDILNAIVEVSEFTKGMTFEGHAPTCPVVSNQGRPGAVGTFPPKMLT